MSNFNYGWPKTIISDTSYDGFRVRTKVLREDGTIHTLYAGEERGMTSGPMPCWTQYGGNIFKTREEAERGHIGLGSSGWNWKIVPDTIEIVRLFGRSTVWYDEVTDAEWDKAAAGFREYMASR